MATTDQAGGGQRIAVLIPVHCEAETIHEVVAGARKYLDDVIVVDDASTDRSAEIAKAAGAVVLRMERRVGKGHSMMEGFRYVLDSGFDAVITMNSSGSHDPGAIPKFIETARRTHLPVLVGNRMATPGYLSPIHQRTIRIMSSLLEQLFGVYVPDPPCGFRYYQCEVLPFLLEDGTSLYTVFETLFNVARRRIRVGPVRIPRCGSRQKSRALAFRDLAHFIRVLLRQPRKPRARRRAIRMVSEAS